jgi:ABC-2 type transport system permease protein
MMNFFRFELRVWLRSPMPWIFLLLLGLLTFAATVSDQISIGGSYGNIWKNAPFVAQNWYAVFSLLTLLLVTAFLNTAAIRDYEVKMDQLIFSRPLKKSGYYFGHFAGAFLIALIPMLGVSLGMWLGVAANSIFEWIPDNRFGPFEVKGHLSGLLVLTLPNFLFAGGIIYAVAINTRSTLYAFVTASALLVGYIVAGNLMQDIRNEQLGALLDPFGLRAFSLETKYWTVEEKNSQALGMQGVMLLNRIIWMGVGLLALWIGYWRFDFMAAADGKKQRKQTIEDTEPYGLQVLGATHRVAPVYGPSTMLAQLRSQFSTEWRGMTRSVAFILLVLLGLLNSVPAMFTANEGYGTHELPVTYTMVDIIRGSFYLFTIIIMIYFSGALIWKERIARMSDITDALPVKNWTLWVGKFGAIMSVMFVLHLVVIAAAVAAQTAMGYHRYELWIYIRELLVMDMLGFVVTLALCFVVHALSPNMYLGFFLSVMLIIINSFIWGLLKFDSNMLEYGATPSYILSDFYGYQPYLKGLVWFNAYWVLFAALLSLGSILLWPRGRFDNLGARIRHARQEWSQYKTFGIAAFALWLMIAGWTFYNTQVLNPYDNSKVAERRQFDYETKYKQYQNRRQPRVYSVRYAIDLYPERRALRVEGQFMTRNIYDKGIDTLWVNTPEQGEFSLSGPRLKLINHDSLLNWQVYVIEPRLKPGDSMALTFVTDFSPKGFGNELDWGRIVQNGTFFSNTDIMPVFGYQESVEIASKNRRKHFGLPEKSRRPALNRADTLNRMDAYIGINSDWVEVETIFSTSPDQIAVAPGSLLRQWDEGGRRYFHYKLDQPSFNFYSFMSAKYEVARRQWNGIDLEVYYHKDHDYNVERMLEAMQQSMAYYTAHFGPYYHKQCRIVEFPRFASFAQAFPGTMPYSEGIGFIQDFKDPEEDIDMMYYVVAHEIAHQYWGHQTCGAQMQGSEMLVETFAQWGALMVMERAYGRDQMRKFLSYEADRYLRGRSTETEKEQPLVRTEGQGYIHYNKGSLQMYQLKEMIGEDKVNLALRDFLQRYRYQPPPYPVSLDALDAFYTQTPDSLRYLIKDLFEDITLYENRCREARVRELADGRWEVTIKVEAAKFKADELGKETTVSLNDYIEIGAFGASPKGKTYGKTLYRERIKMNKPVAEYTFTVSEKPDKAGIDPFSLLIDRNPADNLKQVQ